MSNFFFSGSVATKLDEKNRFVLPQQMRYGLVEGGQLQFSLGLGVGGCIAIYKNSEMEKMVKVFRAKQHQAKYQKFFTFFFSTLHQTTCDKLGRILIPSILKKAAKIDTNIVIAGVLNRIEIHSEEIYEEGLQQFLGTSEENQKELSDLTSEIFSLLDADPKPTEESQETIYDALHTN